MAGTAQDVEAGRAFVTLYLRRTNYDQQVDDLKRDEGSARDEGADRPSKVVSSTTEFRASIPEGVAANIAKGAAMKTGAIALTASLSKLGVIAAATAPALVATGTAASGAAVGLGAMWAAAAPIVIPLAVIAVAAGLVYAAFFKWDELPFVVKALMLVLFPLVVVVRMAVLAFKMLKLAVAIVTAPFWLAAKAVRGFFAAITAIPRVIAATIGQMRRMAVAAVLLAVKVAQSAVKIAKSVAGIPGKIAQATSTALRNVGASIAKIGAIATGISGAIVGSATLAARSWARYGETIRGVQNDLMRFQLTAEEASIIDRVAHRTGESTERLAEQMRDGTRDFSRWRNEMRLSGTLMSGAQLSAALALSRAYWSLRGSVFGLKVTIAEALGPALIESAELFTGMVRGITRWVEQNKPLVVQVFKIASAVGIAAVGITTLGGAIAGVGTIVTPFTALLATAAGVLALIEVRAEAGRSIWAAYGESVRRVAGTVTRHLGQMLRFTDSVIGGITDALMAGDLATAVDVMWNAAKVAWISALLEIDELTSGTFGGIIQSLAAARWAAAGESAVNALRIAWLEGVDFLTGIWGRVVDAADTAWVGILSGFDTVISGLKTGLAEMLRWAIENVFVPLATSAVVFDVLLVDTGAGDKAVAAINKLNKAMEEIDEDEGVEEGPGNREGRAEARQAARQTIADTARLESEREIETIRKRQAELAGQSGEEAKQKRTENQKALDDAIAAAKDALDDANKKKLRDSDFAVSQNVQSITRFSGEALGLSVGRTDDSATKTLKLTADMVKELKLLRKEMYENGRDMRRILAMGGFR